MAGVGWWWVSGVAWAPDVRWSAGWVRSWTGPTRQVLGTVGVMTAPASSVSITERIAMAPVVRSVTVLAW